MAYDELLRLTGSSGNPLETVTASGNGSWVFVGANRMIQFVERVAGAVSGTSPTLDVKIQEADDASGTNAVDLVTFPQRTTSMISGGGAVPGTQPRRQAAGTNKPYVRVVKTIGGSASPTFVGFSVLIETPSPNAFGS
jgi:hypothetical protein